MFNRMVALTFKRFCKHCTLHGFYYYYCSVSWIVHFIWSIIIGSSLVLCIYLSHMIWGKFVDNPTFTVVESTHYPIDRISFPAVTVCDPEFAYGPNTNNITYILKLRGYNDFEINKYYESFTNIKRTDFVVEDNVKKIHSTLEDLGYTHDIVINMMKKPCNILIQECVWRSKVVDCWKMFREVFTIMGYCCQFDTLYFREKSGQSATNFGTGIETSEALEIVVNSQKIFANGSSVDSFVYLYVFDQQNNLTLLDSSITLTPSTYFDITVSVWAIDSSEEVQSLPLESRKCFLPTDTKIASNSYQVCMTISIMRKVVQHCRCVPFNYKFDEFDVENYPICTWERLHCIYQTLNRVQSDVRDFINQCYQKCDYVQYETEAEYVKVDREIDSRQRGSCRVAIHFADNTCIKYRREVLYTWDQMLANLGGIFGLCLGGSIISIIEILWFTLDLISTLFKDQRRFHNQDHVKKKMAVNKRENVRDKNKTVFTLMNKIADMEKPSLQRRDFRAVIKNNKKGKIPLPYIN